VYVYATVMNWQHAAEPRFFYEKVIVT